MRHHQPRKIFEVGSGFSSALILDTIDSSEDLGEWAPTVTFVEPFPDRLNTLLSESDKLKHRIITKKVQEINPHDIADSLGEGDLLFIDSSHVLKCGSDLQYLLFRVLPLLKQNTFIHFHDIFRDFEYPEAWLISGVAWNECYALQCFLAYNNSFKIHLFASYVNFLYGDWMSSNMPLCTLNHGGSLYLKKCV